MKRITGILTLVLAITVIVLDLSIYFCYDGNGQMYTAERIGTCLKIMVLPFLLWLTAVVVSGFYAMKHEDASSDASSTILFQKQKASSHSWLTLKRIRIVLAAAAVLLIVCGIANGGMRDVLIKAINICTECIGLG